MLVESTLKVRIPYWGSVADPTLPRTPLRFSRPQTPVFVPPSRQRREDGFRCGCRRHCINYRSRDAIWRSSYGGLSNRVVRVGRSGVQLVPDHTSLKLPHDALLSYHLKCEIDRLSAPTPTNLACPRNSFNFVIDITSNGPFMFRSFTKYWISVC